MYAVIEQGSKQYKVAQGESLDIELTGAAPDATTLEIDKVLLVSDGQNVKIGNPYVTGAKVIASFQGTADESIIKGQKLFPQHFRRRKAFKRRVGHRQKYHRIIIDKIEA